MAITVETLYQQALELSEDNRVDLAERLLESVDPDPTVIEAQSRVAHERLAELESGKVAPIPGPEALRKARESIAKHGQG